MNNFVYIKKKVKGSLLPPWYFDALSHSLCGLAPASSVWATEWRVYSTADDVPVNSTHLLQNLEKNFFSWTKLFFFFFILPPFIFRNGNDSVGAFGCMSQRTTDLGRKIMLKAVVFSSAASCIYGKIFSLCPSVALRCGGRSPRSACQTSSTRSALKTIYYHGDNQFGFWRSPADLPFFFFGYMRKKKSKIPKFCFWDRIVPWRSRIIALEGVIVVVAAKRSFLVPFITAYCTERRKGEIWLVAVIRKNSCFY